ncbi:uncharacterized protein LOC111070779 [Drosophila obscura]|uniref:uncharacterized protein LOC111070779 n=1 Tax=Drosophila obscura TaxID=7282 RepID=UPI000BA01E7F|nr:uncharacterized protein LOC111070779 [Drosophila obscura]XP_022217355.1 uncharacterized protein LOC111070779 [Drosophila obscura]XP_022217357.1 uncharacterized protein LOC111070779 [Drosophila obscura]
MSSMNYGYRIKVKKRVNTGRDSQAVFPTVHNNLRQNHKMLSSTCSLRRPGIRFPSVLSSALIPQTSAASKTCVKINSYHYRCRVIRKRIEGPLSGILFDLLSLIMLQRHRFLMVFVLLITSHICLSHSLLVEESKLTSPDESSKNNNISRAKPVGHEHGSNSNSTGIGSHASSGSSSVAASGYLEKLERSVGAVLIKVAYGTSTTKRSIPDNSYASGLTTVATPLLTTQRYQSVHQQQITSGRQRNYELDLERDHALPTSAPNADILKSNNNPTYPNPNRHHSHDRDRHRHTMQYNSTPVPPSIPNLLKKTIGAHSPTIPMYPGDIPLYSPPSRTFFTPPLPPEYQNPFADKPTLRGSNNEGLIAINRRPIPPPSLMPSQDRIPIRPPELGSNSNEANGILIANVSYDNGVDTKSPVVSTSTQDAVFDTVGIDRKKALNTPARQPSSNEDYLSEQIGSKRQGAQSVDYSGPNKKQEVLPNIRRILGSNGKKSDIPAVLLKQVTPRPVTSFHHPPSSPIVLIENSSANEDNTEGDGSSASPNINQSKHLSGQLDFYDNANQSALTTPAAAAAIGDVAATSFSYATTNAGQSGQMTGRTTTTFASTIQGQGQGPSGGARDEIAAAAAASAHTTWTWAWNIHIYLSVVLFTILSVYSLYKLLTYNKLTHLFAQSYFVCIHLILITICIMRIFFLCYDAYNIHGTFNIFVAELLLNLPSTFLTVAFSVLILFLFLKSLNHKNNRYSALIRPLTVVVGCGVHVVLCITLHYVESYTLKNHHLYFQQQQQQQYFRRQQVHYQQSQIAATISSSASLASPPPPPRVLTLICQIIYIFICLSLGFLYLYLYRILKRILRSKSQNYIHGYQNLSYAIHITIATALLFVLLAALQIFGAICISSSRQANIVEVDWLQWGYQFSLRLIEIAIITLISWVTGLKTSVDPNSPNTPAGLNGDVRIVGPVVSLGAYGQTSGGSTANAVREKHGGNGVHNSNVTNFFLPCTSSSSQEQFETDYPAICNANTNLHTYTMRTGKLIYDDSYALNPIGPNAASPSGRNCEYQLQEPMYQRPYDTGSVRSAVNHNMAEYGSQAAQSYHQQQQQHPNLHQHQHHMRVHEQTTYMSTDYMTDATTDHYENPNFDLRTSSSVVAVESMQKLDKNVVSSKSGSGSASGSGSSQQQIMLLQSDTCYSEPLEEDNSRFEFNNFERPVFKEKSINNVQLQPNIECWPERDHDRLKIAKSRERKLNASLERNGFENTERRSSNSTNSCSSSNGGGGRYASYNSYERGFFNGVRKSGTLNSIVNGGMTLGGPTPSRAMAVPLSSVVGQRMTANGVQTLALSERAHYYQRSKRSSNGRSLQVGTDLTPFQADPINGIPLKEHQLQQLPYDHNSEEEDEEEDDMISGSNVECTNLINNENSLATPSEINTQNSIGNNKSQAALVAIAKNRTHDAHSQHPHSHLNSHLQHPHLHVQNNGKLRSELSAASSASVASASSNSCTTSSASDSMLVTEQGFLRFRAIEDPNNSQIDSIPDRSDSSGVVVPSLRHPSCSATLNGIDC